MEKKVLFVLGDYLNGSSQNGLCIDSIKNKLLEMEIDVHILCYQENRKHVKDTGNIFTVPKEVYKFLSIKYVD